MVDLFRLNFDLHLAEPMATVVYVLLFSPLVYLGTRSVDRFNLVMMIGVLITYCAFIFLAAGKINFNFLTHASWSLAWPAIPVLFTAFTYQLIIPTLMTYMNQDTKKVRLSIILGSSIPLVVYLIWEVVILGIVPFEGLLAAKANGDTAVMPLKSLLDNPWVFNIGNFFAFFVLTTSYVALALAFLDFLADGLNIKKVGWKKVGLCFAIFVPPTVIALIYPGIFLTALEYAGGISCALLFGLLPPLMVWVGRYVKKYKVYDGRVRGGKPLLSVLMLIVVVELALQVVIQYKG